MLPCTAAQPSGKCNSRNHGVGGRVGVGVTIVLIAEEALNPLLEFRAKRGGAAA